MRGDVERGHGHAATCVPERVEALRLDRARELGAAGRDDPAVDEHVHDVGGEVVEDALVVRDQQDAELRRGPLRTSSMPAATCAQRVDVEAGVGLVEHRDVGFQHRHLQHLVALLLAAGEALVEVALLEAVVHAEPLRPLHELHAHLEHREVVDALAPRHRLAQEVEHRDARDLLGVLEAEEEAPGGALVGGQGGDVARRRGGCGRRVTS